MKAKDISIIVVFLLFPVCLLAQESNRIDLSGYWKFITTENEGSYHDTILLPGTMDEARIGHKVTEYSTTRLSRKYTFAGCAYYQKEVEIPKAYENDKIVLFLERTKAAVVIVDDEVAGASQQLAASQQYDLTRFLPPGKHLLTILVDNSEVNGMPQELHSSHQWTDETQTNWNGIVGKIYLEAKPAVSFQTIQAYPDAERRTITVKATIDNRQEKALQAGIRVESFLFNSKEEHAPPVQTVTVNAEPGVSEHTFVYEMGNEARLWDEYTPNLYRLNFTLTNRVTRPDRHSLTIGLRKFEARGQHLFLNGKRIFLRGKHDACVFPLTGYAPMELADWMRYFDILRLYGFNHVRFHSWCPPDAAFEAADLKGFYLQPELPIWGNISENGKDPVNTYLLMEGKAVMDCFGNHPSFVGFAIGNELWGSVEGMKSITNQLREYDNRHLYAFGSNFHLGWQGEQADEDYSVTARVGGHNDSIFQPHVRSSFSFADAIDGGILNATYPNTVMDYSTGLSFTKKPVIGHETGQFQVYPNPQEIKKYTGVLYPYNLMRFVDRTNRKHGLAKTERFFRASGALSLLCYKADIEMSLRTPDLSGYQILDIQDFPGQGTALVGMLDAFMDSKGLTTPEEFSAFNGEVVPLWVSPSYTWYNDEKLSGKIQLFNYPEEELTEATIGWKLSDRTTGLVLQAGTVAGTNLTRGLTDVGTLLLNLSACKEPVALLLELTVDGTKYKNEYPVWVYPRPEEEVTIPAGIKLFTKADAELFKYLKEGKRALLIPEVEDGSEQTVGGLFTSDYWNYTMFKTISENNKKPVSPGTLGYLIDDGHPLFRNFPTSFHSDWQWWAPARNARPLIMDDIPQEVNMIVEAIDNAERNHRLGVIFECKVGEGQLFVCMIDLLGGGHPYKECKQLLNAICTYLDSECCNWIR